MQCIINNSKSSRLWNMIDRQDWEGTCDLLRLLCGRGNDSNQSFSLLGKRKFVPDMSAKLPLLSYAIYKDVPKETLVFVLECLPFSSCMEDTKGRLPLHIACIRKCSPAIIDVLLEHYEAQEQVVYPDKHGNLPIHHAVMAVWSTSSTPNNKNRLIERKMMKTKRSPNHQERPLPELTNETLDAHLDILSSLLAAHPSAVFASNRDLESPLDIARRFENRQQRLHPKQQRHPRRVYTMLYNTSKVLTPSMSFKKGRRNPSVFLSYPTSRHDGENDTATSSSHFLDFESSYFLFEDAAQDQAIGERPARRNATANILMTMPCTLD